MQLLLFLHLLGAAIWTGGHIVLAVGILPGALKRRDPSTIRAFENVFEPIGMPALLTQIVTGLWLATMWLPFDNWWGTDPIARSIQIKLALLALTAVLAAHARFSLIPKLNADTLPKLGWHIIAVTLTGIAFVAVGGGFRFGGLFQ